jgi:hypothetical protein
MMDAHPDEQQHGMIEIDVDSQSFGIPGLLGRLMAAITAYP